MTQKDKIFHLIKEAGISGIGSNELRSITRAVDVPKSVSTLRKEGHSILSQDLHDGTVKYFYNGTESSQATPTPKKILRYEYETYTEGKYEFMRRIPIYG
jgi:hypothetical protein